ncbi:kinesin-like protein KIN-12C [Malus domestica]|uniref:kinesin-like protein KIN-12C n=1 Tax=Malus domestica TaxID=3750 RepID=UPI003976D8D5
MFYVQLLDTLEGNLPCSNENQNSDTIRELEDCRIMNSKLIWEVDELQLELQKHMNSSQATSGSVRYSFSKETEEFRQSDKYSIEESCRYMEVSRNKDKLEIQSELKRVIF